MAEVDVAALRRKGWATDEEWEAMLAALERAEDDDPLGDEEQRDASRMDRTLGQLADALDREYDCEEKAERLETAIRRVKDENERLRLALGRWDEHLPGCAKWRHVTERVGSLDICSGEDVLVEEQDCTCGYEGRWAALELRERAPAFVVADCEQLGGEGR